MACTVTATLFIPYIEVPSLPLLFGIEIHPFSVFVAGGVLLGASLAARAARWYGPGDDTPLRDIVIWALGGGMLGAHFLHVFGYHPEILREQGVMGVLRIWDGISSMGGVLGSLIGMGIFFKRRGLKMRPYLDAIALGAAPGWSVARIGCFFAHDHPGIRTDFPLAVAYPGGARHDLGLYDCLLLAAISLVLYLVARKKRPEGTIMGLLAILYSLPRFYFDTLRATDLSFVDGRYFGLTPAQFITPVLCVVGVSLIVRGYRQARPSPAPTVSSA